MIIHKKEHPYMSQCDWCKSERHILPDKQTLAIKHDGEIGENYTTIINLERIANKNDNHNILIVTPFNVGENKNLPEQLEICA